MTRRNGDNYSGARWQFSDRSHRNADGSLRRDEGVTIMGSSTDAHIRRQHANGIHTDCDRSSCSWWTEQAKGDRP